MLGVVKKNVQPGQLSQQVLSWQDPRISEGGQYDYTSCEDIYSRSVNLILDRDVAASAPPGVPFTTRGAFWTIGWLAGNAEQTVDVDVQSGTNLTVVGRNVNVRVSYPDLGPKLLAGQIQLPLDVRAVLGFEGGPPISGFSPPARRTIEVGDIPPQSNSNIFRVPRFASASVMRNKTFGVPAMQLNQLEDTQGNLVDTSMIGKLDQDTVSICDGSIFFTVTNNSNVLAVGVSIVFYLAI